MIEARSVFRHRRVHRAKAHLVLSAMRHRAAELGDRVRYVRAETYREGPRRSASDGPVTAHHPTSHTALRLVRSLPQVRVLQDRGFLLPHEAFRARADGRTGGRADGRTGVRLRQGDFHHWSRRELDLPTDQGEPAGGAWNHDRAHREQPPKGTRALGAPAPYRPREDDIDEEVRADRDRCAPADCAAAAEAAWHESRASINSVEGVVRQIAGRREYVWQLYWRIHGTPGS